MVFRATPHAYISCEQFSGHSIRWPFLSVDRMSLLLMLGYGNPPKEEEWRDIWSEETT